MADIYNIGHIHGSCSGPWIIFKSIKEPETKKFKIYSLQCHRVHVNMLKLKKYTGRTDFKKSGGNGSEVVGFLQEQVLNINIITS